MKEYLERDLGTFKLIDFEGEGHFGVDFGSYYESGIESLEKCPEFTGKSVKQILESFVASGNLVQTKEKLNVGCNPEPVRHSITQVIYENKQNYNTIDGENFGLIQLTWDEYISLGCPETLKTNLEIKPSK